MKIIIYQTLVRLFGNNNINNKYSGTIEENGCGKMADFTDTALKEIKNLGITHIWYTGLLEHATMTDYSKIGILTDKPEIVKGRAGSPYAVKDYYDIDPDLAINPINRMEEFNQLINRTHNADLKVIIDFIPNHVAREYHSDIADKPDFGDKDNKNKQFDINNNFYYLNAPLTIPENIHPYGYKENFDITKITYNENPAKATGNNCFTTSPTVNDWYETVKLNYGINFINNEQPHTPTIADTWIKMLDILTYWTKKNVDGFRCDMAEMVPVEFWQWVIPQIKQINPEIIFIAEIYNPSQYRDYLYKGGFDLLYDKVGLYDTLRSIITGQNVTEAITLCRRETEDISDKMLCFLENHDEQRISSRFFADNPYKAIPAMALTTTIGCGAAMIYFGQEIGETAEGATGFSSDDGRTSIFDYCSLPEYIKWINNGKYDGALLNKQQQQLRNLYQKLLNFTLSSEAIKNGQFYDLMWSNNSNNNIYIYIRHNENEKILFILNFKEFPINQNIKIPTHAQQTANISPNKPIKLKEAINGNRIILSESTEISDQGINITLQPFSYNIFYIEQNTK